MLYVNIKKYELSRGGLHNYFKKKWNAIDKKNRHSKESEWKGWILAFNANQLFQNLNYKSGGKNLFKASYIDTINRIISKLEQIFCYSNDQI